MHSISWFPPFLRDFQFTIMDSKARENKGCVEKKELTPWGSKFLHFLRETPNESEDNSPVLHLKLYTDQHTYALLRRLDQDHDQETGQMRTSEKKSNNILIQYRCLDHRTFVSRVIRNKRVVRSREIIKFHKRKLVMISCIKMIFSFGQRRLSLLLFTSLVLQYLFQVFFFSFYFFFFFFHFFFFFFFLSFIFFFFFIFFNFFFLLLLFLLLLLSFLFFFFSSSSSTHHYHYNYYYFFFFFFSLLFFFFISSSSTSSHHHYYYYIIIITLSLFFLFLFIIIIIII